MHGAQRKIYLIHAIHFHFLLLNTLHCIWQGIVPIRRSVFWCNCVRCMSTAVHLSSRLGWGQASPEECFIHFAVAWKPNSLLRRCSSPLPEIQYQVLKSLMQSMHNSLALSNGEVWMLVALCLEAFRSLLQDLDDCYSTFALQWWQYYHDSCSLKGQFAQDWKCCYHLLTPKSFKTCMTLFSQWTQNTWQWQWMRTGDVKHQNYKKDIKVVYTLWTIFQVFWSHTTLLCLKQTEI